MERTRTDHHVGRNNGKRNWKIVADHLWFNFTEGFRKADLALGDKVTFFARVASYEKGYKGYDLERAYASPRQTDYHLARPTKVEKVG